jgi:hypothetical protein
MLARYLLARHSPRLGFAPNVFDADLLLLKRTEQAHLACRYQFGIAILKFDSQEWDIAVVVDRSRDPNPPTRQGILADFMREALLHHGAAVEGTPRTLRVIQRVRVSISIAGSTGLAE